MRNPEENAGGRAPGRRRNPSGHAAPPRQGSVPGDPGTGGRAGSDPSLFTPGYSGGRTGKGGGTGRGGTARPGGATGQWASGPYPAAQYGSAGSAAGKGPIRGFPPAPGQPPPLYPPGQFSAWNRGAWHGDNGYGDPGAAGADGGAWLDPDPGATAAAGPGPAMSADPEPGYPTAGYADEVYPEGGYAEPDYSALAVSDPAADVTSTQSWGTVDDSPVPSGWSDLSSPGERDWHTDSYADHVPPGAEYGADVGAPGEFARTAADGPGPSAPEEFALAGPGEIGPPEPGEFGPAADPRRAATRGRRGAAPGARRAAGRPPGGPDTGPGPAGRQGARGHGSRGRTRGRGRRRPGRILIAAGLAVLVVAATAGYLWYSGRHHSPPAALPPTTSRSTDPSPSPSSSPAVSNHIASRATDPVPLTLAELFPAKFADGAITYTRTVQKGKARCAGALIGGALAAAVGHAVCTQVMRASYLSSNKLMGTIGVLNLASAAAAEKAGKAAGPADFIAQLPAAKGPTKRLTKGTGVEAAEVKGHYLVLVWAEFTNLRPPKSAAQRRALEAFITILIQKTANVSIASRMVTGRPAV
jgi:hypothetical protein